MATETPVRILVIDDEPIIHESLKKVLGREGFQVSCVLSAREGLGLLSRESFALVLTDLMMPEMDGLEFLAELKKASIPTPAIMITGYPTIRTALQSLRLGAADYIPKPFTRKELLPPVWRTLRKARQETLLAKEDAGARGGSEPPAIEAEQPADPMAPLPGDKYCLPEHAWAVYEQEGTFAVGVEESFLRSIGRVVEVVLPEENDLVEQGFPGIRLVTQDGEEHHPFLPVSGRVVERNRGPLERPSEIQASTWLIRVIPSHLSVELPFLKKVSKP
jgi:CheY-like chemotaxis protein